MRIEQALGLAVAWNLQNTTAGRLSRGKPMLSWALVFLVLALVAAVVGFTDIAGAAASIAQILFFLFLVLLAVSAIAALLRGKSRI